MKAATVFQKYNLWSFALIFVLLFVFFAAPLQANAAPANIGAKGAILLDLETGAVLWEQNGYAPLEPASTTKILTALLALDTTSLDVVYQVSPQAAAVGESSANLQVGEVFNLKNLLVGALVKSANDACYAIAETVAGNEALFVHWLNVKAGAVGAYTGVLKNTNGLPAEGHVLSSYDLALIGREAMEHALFAKLVQSKTATMEGGNYNRQLKNTNKLLQTNPAVIGIKTGTTNNAGSCLVSAMTQKDRTVISVVLHSPDRYGESERILNYGIQQFTNVSYAQKGQVLGYLPVANSKEGGTKIIAASNGLSTILKADQPSYRLAYAWLDWNKKGSPSIQAGTLLGTLLLYDKNDQIIDRVNLVAETNLTYKPLGEFFRKLKGKLFPDESLDF